MPTWREFMLPPPLRIRWTSGSLHATQRGNVGPKGVRIG
jgi:hypothetical protein